MACPCGTEEPAIHLIASKDGNISRIVSLNRIYINEESMMRKVERRGPRSFPHELIHGPGHPQDLKEQHPEAGRRKGRKAIRGCDLYDSITTPITKASDPPLKHAIIYSRQNAAQTYIQAPEYIYKNKNGVRYAGGTFKTSWELYIQGLEELPEVARRGALKVRIPRLTRSRIEPLGKHPRSDKTHVIKTK